MLLRSLLFSLGLLLLPFASSAAIPELPDGLYARIETPRGEMLAELFYRQAPLTVCNFVGLAEGRLGPKPGVPFFDGLSFHRVVSGFVIQGGDPLATGEGGPGYEFPDEFSPGLRHDGAGVLSMANGGPDTNGSQFFITLADTSRLNYLHSVFGRLVAGHDVPARIQKTDTMRVTILRKGAAALAFTCDRAAFDALSLAARRFQGSPEPGPASAFDDHDGLLPTDVPRARNFNIKLLNFRRSTGRTLTAALLAATPESLRGDAASRDLALRQLAASHGITDAGIFALRIQDSATWFVFAPGLTPAALTKLRQAAADRSLRNIAQMRSLVPQPLTGAQLLKAEVDAWLDELCFALEP